jgi:hypothetical protein
MRFLYILAGWEGSAHDGRVLQDAQTRGGFATPKGKYWLGDAGYGCTEFVLSPYRGVRYHLKEQKLAGRVPENPKELFNLRHASLRNVIERIFGVVKRKFKILNIPAEYSLQTQHHLILALCGLANFMTIHEGISEEEYNAAEADISTNERDSRNIVQQDLDNVEMASRRDALAAVMWEDYCLHKNIN